MKENKRESTTPTPIIFTQRQHWLDLDLIILMEESGRGSLQIELYHEPLEDGSEAYLRALWVNTSSRERGLATALMQRAEILAIANGCQSLDVAYLNSENALWTRNWFKRIGFKEFASKRTKEGTIHYLRKDL